MKPIRTHYENLKVTRDAPELVIRAAYKSLSQKYHPDKNPGDARAAKIMTMINKSYEVLSDTLRRRAHDDWIARAEAALLSASQYQSTQRPQRTSPAREHQNPLHSKRPPPSPPPPRERPLSLSLARALTAFSQAIGASYAIRMGLVLGFIALSIFLLDQIGYRSPPPPESKPYVAQAPLAQTSAPGQPDVTCKQMGQAHYRCRQADGTVWESTGPTNTAPPQVESAPTLLPAKFQGNTSTNTSSHTGAYIKPKSAPNGSPWPKSSGYVKAYPIANADGLSSVTVDNRKNDSDVFVKLVSLDGDSAYPVRQFFIPAFGIFTVKKVRKGGYDIRYRDLDNGGLSRSEDFALKEIRTDGGVQYSKITMTLYKVEDGNMQTFPLAESEF